MVIRRRKKPVCRIYYNLEPLIDRLEEDKLSIHLVLGFFSFNVCLVPIIPDSVLVSGTEDWGSSREGS